MIVLDSSVVVDFLLGRESAASASVQRALRSDQAVVAPELLDAEVAQVIRRYELRTELDASAAVELASLCASLPVTRFPHSPLLARAFIHRFRLSIYDALYVALAEGLGAVLFTGDRGIAMTPGILAEVRFLRTQVG